MIFKWVGEILLGTSAPVILSEIGFLDRLEDPQQINWQTTGGGGNQ